MCITFSLFPIIDLPNLPDRSSKHCKHLRIVRRSQSRNRIPPLHSREPNSSTALIGPVDNIIEHAWILVERRIQKPERFLTLAHTLVVDERDDRAKGRGGGGRAVDLQGGSVDDDDVVGAVRGNVRDSTCLFDCC